MKYYTGIGSRETPLNIIEQIHIIAANLSKKGYILRSGGANGADLAFENGCDSVSGLKDIYLPWKNFNKSKSSLYKVSQEALELASRIHPAWNRCSFGGKNLHGRNCYQVLGLDLKTPSEFLICWTKDGESVGGTRTAIVLSQNNNIPVYNLATENGETISKKLEIYFKQKTDMGLTIPRKMVV